MFYAGFQMFIGFAYVKLTRTNVGNAMNPSTGIFTAPRPGKYFFTYSGISNAATSQIELHLNGVLLGTAFSEQIYETFSHHATLQLSQGDQIRLFLKHGSVYGDGRIFTSFVGILIEQDVF
jgi:hypothetical protein